MTRSPLHGHLAALIAVAAGLATAPAACGAAEDKVLTFCKKNPARCAISVAAISEKWEGHLNPDRAQPLASTSKIVNLIAYAQAVAAGKLKPTDTVHRDDWARFLTLDGDALANSWNDLGQPTAPTLDGLATTMIRRSDNAFPDWLRARLGAAALDNARKLFLFHDPPAGISAMFGMWFGANGEGGAGDRLVRDYGNFGVVGYQGELETLFASFQNPAAVDQARTALCVQPPWLPGPPPCSPPQPSASAAVRRVLSSEFFTRSTTRSYLKAMRALLERKGLPPAAHKVVERHLESWFDLFPTLRKNYTRYGLKGGSLESPDGTNVRTWAHYLEDLSKKRYVVVVFLQSVAGVPGVPTTVDLSTFAQQFSFNPTFRAKVKKALAAKESRPELLASITGLTRNGNTITLQGRVDNLAPNALKKPFTIELLLSPNPSAAGAVLLKSAQLAALAGNKGAAFTLVGTAAGNPAGQLALLNVDATKAAAEQDETDNVLWSRLP